MKAIISIHLFLSSLRSTLMNETFYGMLHHSFVTLEGCKTFQKIVAPSSLLSLFFCLFELNDCLPARAKRGMAKRSFSAKGQKKRDNREEGATIFYNIKVAYEWLIMKSKFVNQVKQLFFPFCPFLPYITTPSKYINS